MTRIAPSGHGVFAAFAEDAGFAAEAAASAEGEGGALEEGIAVMVVPSFWGPRSMRTAPITAPIPSGARISAIGKPFFGLWSAPGAVEDSGSPVIPTVAAVGTAASPVTTIRWLGVGAPVAPGLLRGGGGNPRAVAHPALAAAARDHARAAAHHQDAARGVHRHELREGAHRLAGVLEPGVDVAVDAAGEPRVEAGRGRGDVGARARGDELLHARARERELIEADLAEQVRQRVGVEPEGLAREQAEGDEPERPHVRAGADAASAIGLLGGHEERRPEGLRPGLLALRDELGDAEIEDLGREGHVAAARGAEEDVLQLEVAVDDALLVGLLERVANLLEDLGDVAEREGAGAVQAVGQLLALEELHHQEGRVCLFVDAGGDDLDNVVALDLGGGAGFQDEALADGRVGRELGGHHLEGALLAGAELLGDVDRAHAAGPQSLHDPEITTEDCPRLQSAHDLLLDVRVKGTASPLFLRYERSIVEVSRRGRAPASRLLASRAAVRPEPAAASVILCPTRTSALAG